jgi:hypothetical protein
MVRITNKKGMRLKHKTRRYRSLRQRKQQNKRRLRSSNKRRTRNRRKQRGGFNKTKTGSINYFSIDNRYRPVGGISDAIKYHGKKLMNSIQGNYKPINPSISKQPIGKPLSANNLKFGVGTTSDAQSLFNEASLRSSAFPNSPKVNK